MLDAYLSRLGVEPPAAPDHDALRRLHAAHLRAVPFENLDIHLGRPIVLDEAAIVDKIVGRGRGGFCYELNTGFAWLLTALGFRVAMLEARVWGENGLGIRYDHMTLRVDLDETWLADVGFGASFGLPLRLDETGDQPDPNGTYRITPAGDEPGWRDVSENGVRQYRFSLEPRALADYQPGCTHHQTSPQSHFTRNTVCSRETATGRVTIRGRTLIVTEGEHRRERELASDAELAAAYRKHFGMEIDAAQLASG